MSNFKVGDIVRIKPRDCSSDELGDFRNHLWEISGQNNPTFLPDYWKLIPVEDEIHLSDYGATYRRSGGGCNWDGKFLRDASDCVPVGGRWERTGWTER